MRAYHGGHNDHIVNHINQHHLRSDNTLHVIGVISNSVRYHSRYRLFREWYKEMLETPCVKVHVVELAFGDRHHECTEAGNPDHLQLRTNHEIWHKENMINRAVKHLLPRDWRYLCWSDCDVFWADKGWAQETLHQLQHYPVVQPWQDCLDLGPMGQVLKHHKSFCHVHQLGVKKQTHPGEPYMYPHSGFAWACTRHFWENLPGHGLMDFPILGSADHHMAWAMINRVDSSVHHKMADSFKRLCHEWQDSAYRVTQGHLGCTPGRIEHKFHGPKSRRFYRERWQILIDNKFDPDRDIGYDAQGLVQIIGKPQLEQDIHKYMRARHEDSIEID